MPRHPLLPWCCGPSEGSPAGVGDPFCSACSSDPTRAPQCPAPPGSHAFVSPTPHQRDKQNTHLRWHVPVRLGPTGPGPLPPSAVPPCAAQWRGPYGVSEAPASHPHQHARPEGPSSPSRAFGATQPQPMPWETLSRSHPGKPHPSSRHSETPRDSVCCWFKALSSEWLAMHHTGQNRLCRHSR